MFASPILQRTNFQSLCPEAIEAIEVYDAATSNIKTLRGQRAIFNTMFQTNPSGGKILSPLDAQSLLERIFTPGSIQSQRLFDTYARYLLATPGGNEKVTYPLSGYELTRPRTNSFLKTDTGR